MESLLKKLFFSFLIAIAAAILGWQSASILKPNQGPDHTQLRRESIVIREADLNIGRQYETATYSHHFFIQNCTSSEIRIVRFETSCECAGIKPLRLTLAPGQEVKLEVSIDLRKVGRGTKFNRSFSLWVQPILQEEDQLRPASARWVFTGTVIPVFRTEEPLVELGQSSVCDHSPRAQTIIVSRNAPNANPPQIQCFCKDGKLTATVVPIGKKELSVDVEWSGRLALGEHRGQLELLAGEGIPPYIIEVVRWVVQDTQVSPPSVQFGPRCVGDLVSETVTVNSLFGRAITLQEVKVSNPNLVVVLNKRSSVSFEVRCKVRTEGPNSSTVQAVVTDPHGTQEVVDIEIVWEGVPALTTAGKNQQN